MNPNAQFRQPNDYERSIFDRLLQTEFPGRDKLRLLLADVKVRPIDNKGGLEIRSHVSGTAPVVKRIPVEAEAKDEDGLTIHVLLHVVEGQPVELEIFKDDGSLIKHMPVASAFELIVLPPGPDN